MCSPASVRAGASADACAPAEEALKLGTRLFVALAIPIAALIVAFAVMEDGADRGRSRDEVEREGRVITRAVQIATSNALRDAQLDDVRKLIDDLSGHRTILAIRLFDSTGAVAYVPLSANGTPKPAADALRRVLRGGRLAHEYVRVEGRPVVSWLAPLQDPRGRPLGAIQLLQHETFVEEDARASSRAIALFAAMLIGAVALTVFAVVHLNVARPVEELVRSVRGIGEGDWGEVVAIRRRDELGRLAGEFNSMRQRLSDLHGHLVAEQGERRRIESDLREAERLASLGRFAAGVAHEIGTPLNVISGRAEALGERIAGDAAAERGLRIIVSQIDRITRIVRGVLDFARARELQMVPTELGRTLDAVVELVEEQFEARGITIESTVARGLPLLAADPDQLEQVFLNLAMNAADAMPAGGMLRIGAGLAERVDPAFRAARRPCVVVTFEDTGAGIPPGDLERVFEPFFTTKEVGAGTGLGLAVSYGIIREHGGWIDVTSTVGRGSTMTVCLPLGDGAPQTDSPDPREAR